MEKDVLNSNVLPIVRHGLQILTGVLIARGELDAANAETLAGSALGLFTVGWWWIGNRRKAR